MTHPALCAPWPWHCIAKESQTPEIDIFVSHATSDEKKYVYLFVLRVIMAA
jgi:hypothetical protein